MTEENKKDAATLKSEGNKFFSSQNFTSAIECYSKAIDLE